jgi:superfamily I DNA and/or RNA helicase
MTRAQHGLVIFGNAKMLKKDPMWGFMLEIHKMQVFSDMDKATEFIR